MKNKVEKTAIVALNPDAIIDLNQKIQKKYPNKYRMDAFFSKESSLNEFFEGISFFNFENINEILLKLCITTVIIDHSHISQKRRFSVASFCLHNDIKVLKLNEISHKENNSLNYLELRSFILEDLFHEYFPFNEVELEKEFFDKTILITGGAGSIGSELVARMESLSIKKLVVVDFSEANLWELLLRFNNEKYANKIIFELADIRDSNRIELLLSQYDFDFVIHTAAYKQVPLLERNLYEAIRVNVSATINLIELSNKYKVKKFLYLSTDKAVNPMSIMGLTKRAAEVYISSFQNKKDSFTKFIIARLGNVIGSKGSVVPYLENQILNNEVITITHKNVERFFITNSNTCQFLLQSIEMGQGGELFVLDMSNPVKITELASLIIALSNKIQKSNIQFIGLRQGEKMKEELYSADAVVIDTNQLKIKRVIEKNSEDTSIFKVIEELKANLEVQNMERSLELLKMIVPEYRKTS